MILEISESGDIICLYSDQINLYEIGRVTSVKRASFIEFNETKQYWEVIDAKTKEIVYQNKIREKCIEWEIINFGCGGKYYNEIL